MKNIIYAVFLVLPFLGGCHSKLLPGGGDEYHLDPVWTAGPAVGSSGVTPTYDQASATPAQDQALIASIVNSTDPQKVKIFDDFIANQKTSPFPNMYDLMNGKHNWVLPHKGINSIQIDMMKALFRLGRLDQAELDDVSIIHNNVYPVPVYQGTL